jgi:hypothetical protein
MSKREYGDIPGKILRMLPGKRLGADEDLLIAATHKVENIENFEAADAFLDILHMALGYLAFIQGGVLNRIREEGWLEEDEPSFEEFLETIGIARSMAEAQIRVYNGLIESECSQSDSELLGWVRLRLIAPFLTRENRAGWIDLADSKLLPDLADYVREKESKSSPRTNLLRESVMQAGYRKALHIIEELWPEVEIKVYEP